MKVATKTKAYTAKSAQSALEPFEIVRREPNPNDVVIDIKYCGICHSDLHQVRNEWKGTIYPIVPGHEIIGTVIGIGDAVTKYKIGDNVGVGCMVNSCRKCTYCKDGHEELCDTATIWTYNSYEKDSKTPTYGGYSKTIVVDENFVLRIPKGLPLDAAAPLLCAGITTYSPLKYWKAGPGKSVAVVGLGGLGHMAVKIAKGLGANVTVLSRSLKKKDDALSLGANSVYATSDPKTFENLSLKFDLIIDTVSAEHDLNLYLNLLKPYGTMILVGAPPETANIQANNLISKRRILAGSLIGGVAETQEMLDFCAKKNIVADIEIIPIQQINSAYERMLKGDVHYRFVIDCSSLG